MKFTTEDAIIAKSLGVHIEPNLTVYEVVHDLRTRIEELKEELAALHIENDQERLRTCLALECADSYRSRMVLALSCWSFTVAAVIGIVLWRVR
jgi:NH3-dependent NAD+ synthetase